MTAKPICTSALLFLAALLAGPLALTAEAAVQPQPGQTETCQLGDKAQIDVPGGYVFLDQSESVAFMTDTGNIPSNQELGTIINQNSDWFIVFEFDPVGYVKDDTAELDADALIASIRAGNAEANKERARRNISALNITGWHTKPRYNTQTNNLEWCLAAESQGEPVLNYNTRILGREGVMQVTLVCGPEQLSAAAAAQRTLLTKFAYLPGQKYSEWQAGDKVAEYGLAALIVGGGAAVAYKSGLLGKLIKPLIVGAVVVFGAIAKFWRRLFGRAETA